jgi:hypothetical protein
MRDKLNYFIRFAKSIIVIELVLALARIRALLLFSGIC